MVKKKMKWLVIPVVAAFAFVAFSSFAEESESASVKCRKTGVKTDYCWSNGAATYSCCNTTATADC